MCCHSYRLLFLFATGIIPLLLCSARADEAEVAKEKLHQAKKAFDVEMRKLKKEVTDQWDRREDEARKAGIKKLVDEVQSEREAFDKVGTLPPSLPDAIKNQFVAARTKLDKAYTAANKTYLRLREDAAAAAETAEREQREFRSSNAINAGPVRCLRFSECGYVELKKTTGLIDLNDSFTVESWIRFDGKNNKQATFIGDEVWHQMSPAIDVSTSGGWVLRLQPTDDPAKSIVQFVAGTTNPEWFVVDSSPVVVLDGEWHHIAVSKTPEVLRLFFDGKRVSEEKCKDARFTPSVTDLYIGVRKNAFPNRQFKGEYRAFRISNKARYSEAFVPPASFVKDPRTDLLLDFTGNDATRILDLSGKEHHGVLSDVKWADIPGRGVREEK
jgi:hypothetical protein